MPRPAMTTLYGIRNCDTMKRARAWLDTHGVGYVLHDYRVAGLDRAVLAGWVREFGWEALLNRGGTTFRKLPEAQRQDLDAEEAIALMLAEPAMIRRPVLDTGAMRILGFRPDLYAQVFAA